MKKILASLLLTFIVSALLFSTVKIEPAQAASEQITNGGFESGDLTGWVHGSTAYVVTEDKNSGSYALKLNGSLDNAWVYQNLIQNVSSSTVTAGFYLKTIGFTAGVDWIIYYTDSTQSANTGLSSDSAWTYQDMVPYLTAGKVIYRVWIGGIALGSDRCYVDDVSIIGEPSTVYTVSVSSSPEINADYTINGTSHQTPHDETNLDAGSYNFTLIDINKTVSGVDYNFLHWLINATEDTDLSILLYITGDTTLGIHYETINHYNLSFDSEPSGLSVQFSAGGSWYWTPQDVNLAQGSQTFTIYSASLIRYVSSTLIYGFDHWSITNTTGTFNSTGSSVNYNLQENSTVIMAYITIRIQVTASPALPVYFSSEYYGSNYSAPKTFDWNSGSHTFTALTHTYSPNSSYVYTFDHWLVNGTDQYGSLGITLSFTAATNLTMVYVGSTVTPPYPYIYVSDSLNATWYFRSDTWTVHSILGYKLQTVNTATPAFDLRIDTATKNVSYGVRVWALDLFGNQYELTSGSPAAIVIKETEGAEMMLGYWTCPAYGSMIDSIKVNLYQQFNDEGWSLRRIFVTGSDLLIRLPSASWTFHYYVNRTVGSTYSTFGFGSYTTYNSRIDLQYYKASPWDVALARLWQRNFVGFMFTPWTYWFGDLFWSIILFGCIIMAWLRAGSFKPILSLLWILGGSGSILWALIPATALHVAALMLALAMAITLFRLIYGRRS